MPNDKTRRTMTPLNDQLTERRSRYLQSRPVGRRRLPAALQPPPEDNLRRTRPEIWRAVSADGQWTYDRIEETTTPWLVIYLPTGQQSTFTTLSEARRWTATPEALTQLRAQAHDVISRGGRSTSILVAATTGGHTRRATDDKKAAAGRLGLAMRQAAILDGALVGNEPDARCQQAGPLAVCGGYLADTPAGWVHVDACRECVGLGLTDRRECHNLPAHLTCGDPDPQMCVHPRCGSPAGLVQLCPNGRDRCCDSCCVVLCGNYGGA